MKIYIITGSVFAALAILFGADLYHWVPDLMIISLLISFIGLDKISNPKISFRKLRFTPELFNFT